MIDEKENLAPEEETKEPQTAKKMPAPSEGRTAVKKGLLVMMIAVVIGAILGFGGTSIVLGARDNREKVFTASDFQITLTEGFSEKLISGVTKAYSSRGVSITFRKAGFNSSNEDFTAEQYARSIMLVSGIVGTVRSDGELTYFAAEGTSADGRRITGFAYTFKTDECFWVVEFNVRRSQISRYEKAIKKYAESIVFN